MIRPLNEQDPERIAEAFAAVGWNKPAEKYEQYLVEQSADLRAVLVAVNDYLVRWLRRKYKGLAIGVIRAARALGRLAEASPSAFVHWQFGFRPAAR